MVNDGTIGRVDVTSPAYETPSGISVGDSDAKVRAAYGSQLSEDPNPNSPDGTIFTVEPRETRNDGYRVVLESENGTVASIRAGRLPDVTYVEGCL